MDRGAGVGGGVAVWSAGAARAGGGAGEKGRRMAEGRGQGGGRGGGSGGGEKEEMAMVAPGESMVQSAMCDVGTMEKKLLMHAGTASCLEAGKQVPSEQPETDADVNADAGTGLPSHRCSCRGG